jgi:WD40 repeat protein
MNDQELVRLARLWMEEGPAMLPDRILSDALAEVRVTHQRRRSPFERVGTMKISYALAASFAGILAVVAGAGLLGRPSLDSTSGPASSALTLSAEPVAGFPALGLAFSLDSESVYAGRGWTSAGPVASIHDADTGQETLSVAPAPDAWGVMAFSPDGSHVAIGQDSSRVYETTTGTYQAEFPSCCMVAFSPDGTRIATNGGMVYDLESGRLVSDLPFGGDVTFSPDGSRLLITGREEPGEPYGPGVIAIIMDALGPDDGTSVRLKGDGGVRGWNILGSGAAWSPDGSMVAIPTAVGDVLVWDASTGELVFELRRSAGQTPTPGVMLSAAFSPDSRTLATGSESGTIALWDLGSEDPQPLVATTAPPMGKVFSIAFSPDGRRLLAGSEYEVTWIWGVSAR